MDQSTTIPSARKRGRTALVLLLLVMLCIGGLLALPWMLNRPSIGAALLQQFERRTGHALSVKAWHVRILPSIRVELLQTQLHAPGSTRPLLSADRLEITLQWLPLLEGRVVAHDLVIDRPRLTATERNNGA